MWSPIVAQSGCGAISDPDRSASTAGRHRSRGTCSPSGSSACRASAALLPELIDVGIGPDDRAVEGGDEKGVGQPGLFDGVGVVAQPFGGVAGIAGDEEQLHQPVAAARSEEHTSELQSQSNLVCRLLLEKK